jgi:hypothetical protein
MGRVERIRAQDAARGMRLSALLALVVAFAAQASCAQFGVPWTRSPRVTVVANGDDPRIGMVYDAVAFWNTTLEEAGAASSPSVALRRRLSTCRTLRRTSSRMKWAMR